MLRSRFPARRAICGIVTVAALAAAATPAVALPDGRGYELVSPEKKQGGDVVPMTERTRAAADGDAAAFSSLVSFADAHGGTIGSEYMAERTGLPGTSGWSTHGITPKQEPLPLIAGIFGLDPNYEGEMAADLSRGVYRAYRPITDAPNVAGMVNLYVRDDLRTPGEGFYQVVTDPGFPLLAAGTFPVRPQFVGASADFSHILFESLAPLSRDLPSCTPDNGDCTLELFEWSNGTLRLAGILPGGAPALSSQAGQGASNKALTPHMISDDGSRVFFQAPAGSGNVYMRVNGTTTVQLNISEKSVRPRESPQGASLWTASADGSRVFFTTDEGLVDGDDDGFGDYYMYDVDAPAGHHLTLISRDNNPSDVKGLAGVIGASDDGHYFYFMMTGQLLAGEPTLGNGRALYVWHDGVVRYIGALLSNPGDSNFNSLTGDWSFNSTSSMAHVSADGSHVMFAAKGDNGLAGRWGFTGFDHRGPTCGVGCFELYVFDAAADTLRCASCDPTNGLPTGEVQDNVKVDTYASDLTTTPHVTRALSDDGRYAFFSSPDALVPEDINRRYDAYEYDSVTDRVHLLSSGRSSDGSYFMDASASGRDAFFVTRERLVGWDTDNSYDLYDARVDGGLPEPAVSPPCVGDACQGAVGALVVPGAIGSSGFDGKGNTRERLKPRHAKHKKHCKAGKRRVVKRGKVRCVRRKAHRGRSAVRVAVIGGRER